MSEITYQPYLWPEDETAKLRVYQPREGISADGCCTGPFGHAVCGCFCHELEEAEIDELNDLWQEDGTARTEEELVRWDDVTKKPKTWEAGV